jgi:hypothetical protein
MSREETAELVGFYFGLQRAGNMRPLPLTAEGADAINALRKMLDDEMQATAAKMPPGTLDAWPQKI